MARARNLKPGYFKNETLAECDPLARILFAGLWCQADRAGRLEYRPRRLKAEVLPYDNCDIDKLVDELSTRGFVVKYELENNEYLQIVNFEKHQNPHVREPTSTIPAPGEHSASTGPARRYPANPFPLPSSLNLEHQSSTVPINGNGHVKSSGNGNGVSGHWTQTQRDEYAVKEAIPFLPGADDGERWAVAMAAEDPTDPNHHKAVTAMLAATKKAKVGWVSPERRKH